MKILHWDEMFHPSFGYQINVLTRFQVAQGHDVTVFTSDKIEEHPTFKTFGNSANIAELDDKFTQKYGVKIVRLPIKGHYSGRVLYQKGYLDKIKNFNPDILFVHTHDTFAGINITMHYKKLSIPMVLDNHMLKMASKNKLKYLHRAFFKSVVTPVIVKNNIKVIRTQDDDYVNECYGIPKKQTPYLSFGTDTMLFKPDAKSRKKIRKENDISDNAFVVVYTGKLDEAKGGKFLAEAIKEKFNTNKEVVFLVVGNTRDDEYGHSVEQCFGESENRVIRFKTQNYEDLPPFYQGADLCLFAKQCSLSFFDAQACGLPVVFEANNINIERGSHGNGWVFEPGDINDFREKISTAINLRDSEYDVIRKKCREYIMNNFDYQLIAKEYTDLMISIVEEWR